MSDFLQTWSSSIAIIVLTIWLPGLLVIHALFRGRGERTKA